MSGFATERELDATLEAASTTLKESERLAGVAGRGRADFEAWKGDNGINPGVQAKFFNALSPEDRQKADAEQTAFEQEVARDLEAAVQRAFPAAKPTGGARRRSMA